MTVTQHVVVKIQNHGKRNARPIANVITGCIRIWRQYFANLFNPGGTCSPIPLVMLVST